MDSSLGSTGAFTAGSSTERPTLSRALDSGVGACPRRPPPLTPCGRLPSQQKTQGTLQKRVCQRPGLSDLRLPSHPGPGRSQVSVCVCACLYTLVRLCTSLCIHSLCVVQVYMHRHVKRIQYICY